MESMESDRALQERVAQLEGLLKMLRASSKLANSSFWKNQIDIALTTARK